jgi:AraC family transcriptional activator of pobA
MGRLIDSIPCYHIYGEKSDLASFEYVDCAPLFFISNKYNWSIDPHYHDRTFQLFLIQKGGGACSLDAQVIEVKPHSIIIIPPTVVHGFTWVKNSVGWVLTIEHSLVEQSIQFAEDMSEAFSEPSVLHCRTKHRELEELEKALQKVNIEMHEQAFGFKLAVRAALAQSLTIAARLWREKGRPDESIDHQYRLYFREFHRIVRHSYLEKKSIDDYASEMKISRMHLNRVCRAVGGRSALNVIHDYIILEAKRALKYTSKTASEIGAVLNFDVPAYFSRFFKRHVGMSPKEFRARVSQP